MRTLVIDTSGKALSVALFEGPDLIAARHENVGRGHAEAVVPWIADLPGGGRAETIVAGCGPGSFTGIRSGVAAAHGLGLGWRAKTTGLNSLALIAASCGDTQGEEVLVAIEGGHGELFLQPFACAPVCRLAKPVSLKAEMAAMQFQQQIVIGSGAERLIAARGFGSARAAEADARLWQRLDPSETALPLTPVYVRAPDAKPMAAC